MFSSMCSSNVLTIFSLIALFASGCGKSTGVVTGKVTFEDKPLATGSVLLIGEHKELAQGSIGPDGVYRIDKVMYGAYKVAVYSADPGATGLAAMQRSNPEALAKAKNSGRMSKKSWEPPAEAAKDSSAWFAIPEQYSDAESSGITVTVDQPEVTFDIKMK